MRAWNVPRAGAEVRLPDLPVPEVTEGTVLVKAQAAALNPVDNALAAGTMAQMIPRQYPLVLGRDAAGTVEAIGPGEHQRGGRRRGDRAHAADPPVRLGTLGHHALPATAVTAKPAGRDFTTAAAIPLAGTAALAAVDAIGVKPGQVILVAGASAYAVPLLAARGAAIVTTGAADDAARLTRLGAAAVADYTRGDLAGQVPRPIPRRRGRADRPGLPRTRRPGDGRGTARWHRR
jgi:NADPH:quinone reductase-like Zn-dependent oxidoreductase